jgi:lysozyme
LRRALLVALGACAAPPPPATAAWDVKVCAAGPVAEGVDVSVYQGTIDWGQVAHAGIDFAYIRVSDGLSHLDSKFAANWSGARTAGVLRGAYQFFREDEDPVQQADLLLDTMGPLATDDLPPALDVETTDSQSAATIVAHIGAWIDRVEAATGRKPVIYVGKYFWNDNVGASGAYVADALWIPQWGVTCPDLPTPWTDWAFFQFSAKGTVAGISGDVDRDRFNGDRAALLAFAGVVAGPPDAPPPPPSPDARPVPIIPDASVVSAGAAGPVLGGCGVAGRPDGAWLAAAALLLIRRRQPRR